MMEILFWLCIVAATYSYFWYPGLLLILPRRRTIPASNATPIDHVAIVIAARNEATGMVEKLTNTLALDHAGLNIEVIVASDASDDGTDGIVLRFADKGVRLVRSPQRHGKEYAQGLAVMATDADVIVFTDTGTMLPRDALINLIGAFRSKDIGAVSSVDRFVTPDGSVQGEGTYVRYEMWLRDLETRFYSLVGLSGSFFAARREVCQDWDHCIPSDFGTALNCVRLGMRAVSDRSVIGYYKNIADSRKEYRRKLRTVTRGVSALLLRREVLNFARYGRFAFQIFSHKVMRWSAPWFLIAAFCSCILLARHDLLYFGLLVAQAAIYVSPIVSSAVPALRKVALLRLCAYYVEVNFAILHATVLAMCGRTILSWEPSKR